MSAPLHRAEYEAGDMSATDYIASLEAELRAAHGAYDLAATAVRGAIRTATEIARELEQMRAGGGVGDRAVSGAALGEQGEPERPSPAEPGREAATT